MKILPFGSAGKDLACFLVPQNSVIFRFDNRYHTEFISWYVYHFSFQTPDSSQELGVDYFLNTTTMGRHH